MKIKVEKTITEEVDITLPCYKKSTGNVYFVKLLSEKCTIWVSDDQIQIHDYISRLIAEYNDCTEKEFNEAYIATKGKIESLCYTTKFEDVGELDTEEKAPKAEWEVNNER
jgi:hypothetical protein